MKLFISIILLFSLLITTSEAKKVETTYGAETQGITASFDLFNKIPKSSQFDTKENIDKSIWIEIKGNVAFCPKHGRSFLCSLSVSVQDTNGQWIYCRAPVWLTNISYKFSTAKTNCPDDWLPH